MDSYLYRVQPAKKRSSHLLPERTRTAIPVSSPDGRTIAFVRYLSHWVGDIYTMDGDGGNLKRVTFDSRDVRGLDWTAGGRQIVFASKLRGAYELRVIR